MNNFVLLFVFLSPFVCVADNLFEECSSGTCGAGQRYNVEHESCQPCDPDTFIDIANHSCVDCRNCTQADHHDNEIVIANCTAISDTVIGCNHGHYMVINHMPEMDISCDTCRSCQDDEILQQNCTQQNDTVCTKRSSSDVGSQKTSSNNSPLILVVSIVAGLIVVILGAFLYGARRRIKEVCGCVEFPRLKTRRQSTMRRALVPTNSGSEMADIEL